MLEAEGISTRSTQPQYVVLGYDTETTYKRLETASLYLHAGVPLMASYPDVWYCPSPNGGLPDVGAFLALFRATTGVDPTHISEEGKSCICDLHKSRNWGFALQKNDAMVGISPLHRHCNGKPCQLRELVSSIWRGY